MDAGNGYCYIVSKDSGLYLDVAGGKNADETNVWVWTGNKSDAQKWKIKAASYKVEYDLNGGKDNIPSQKKTYGIDYIVNKTNPIREGYTFLGWSKSSSAERVDYKAGDIYKKNENITLYAVWEKISEDTGIKQQGEDLSMNGEKEIHRFKKEITKATPSRNGIIMERCDICGKINSKRTIYAPKQIVLNKREYVYDGKFKKPSVMLRDVQGNVIDPADYKVSYNKRHHQYV